MDETCVEVKYIWKQLYCVVDRTGQIVIFLLAAERDKTTSLRFFEKAMQDNGILEKVAIGEGGTNKAATDEINAQGQSQIVIRQVKYLNHHVEQDHRAIN